MNNILEAYCIKDHHENNIHLEESHVYKYHQHSKNRITLHLFPLHVNVTPKFFSSYLITKIKQSQEVARQAGLIEELQEFE